MAVSLPLDEFQKAKDLLLAAQRIVLIPHKNPDADAIGATLALKEALENLGKDVTTACIDPLPENCKFLPKSDTFVQNFNYKDFDLIISLDCGAHKLLGFHKEMPELLDKNLVKLINIDHHPSNDFFGTVNIVMPQTPATCFILYLMITSYGWTITQTMATALLHGLYYDTGSFMHSNTSPETLRIAGRLKALGGDHQICVKKQFHTTSIEKLKLWGRAMSRIQLNDKQTVVTAITDKDYTDINATRDDLSGLINYLNHVNEAKFCILLTEDTNGNIKGSMRTQGEEINLSEIAQLFGGGGHKKAAGFTIPGTLQKRTIWDIS